MVVAAGCDQGEPIMRLVVKGAFNPDTLEFGDVIVGTGKSLDVELKNTGVPVFTIDGVEVPESFTFTGLKETIKGKTIQPGSSMMLTVEFDPQQEGEASGDFKITAGTTEVTLHVHGNGVVMKVPDLSIDPNMLDFGTVEINMPTMKPVTIKNNGTAAGTIDQAILMSTGQALDAMGEYRLNINMPMMIPPGGQQVVEVIFTPHAEGPKADAIMFHQAENAGPDLQLTINGTGKIPLGDIVCTPSSLDFGQVQRGMSAMLSVTCAARGGPSRLVGASITQTPEYFSLPTPPATVDLDPMQSGVSIQVLYKPDGMLATHNGMLTVQYTGRAGMATTTVPLTGVETEPPPTTQAIALVLTWDTNQTDVDVHLVRPGASPFDPAGGDCYYANRNPMWGADTTYSPYLDRDVIDGLGPEHLNLARAVPGMYNVYAHYFSDHGHGPSTATVEVFVGGTRVGSYNHHLNCDDIWLVGTVSWDGMRGTFNPMTQVQAMSGQGVCF
jgi:HYDIN/CFA65/VesB family protein/centrosomal CEP192-like protein